jgi:hypothetical protein
MPHTAPDASQKRYRPDRELAFLELHQQYNAVVIDPARAFVLTARLSYAESAQEFCAACVLYLFLSDKKWRHQALVMRRGDNILNSAVLPLTGSTLFRC